MAAADELTGIEPLFPDETESVIRARWNGWANEGLDPAEDVDEWVDTREGSHFHMQTQSGVREAALTYDRMTEVAASGIAVRSWGEYLDDHADLIDLDRLAATFAEGEALFVGPAATAIPAGTIVSPEPVDPEDDPPEFGTAVDGVLSDPLAGPPANLAGVPSGAGGTLAAGTYHYVVTAQDVTGETLPSAETAEVVPGGGTGSVALTWDAVADAIGYRVYRSPDGVVPFGLIGEVTDLDYTDTGDTAPGEEAPIEDTSGGWARLPILASDAGEASNVGANAISDFAVAIDGVVVTNEEPTTGGSETETDERLIGRIRERYAGETGWNVAKYRAVARAWPGVGSVTVLRLADGPGTVRIVLLAPDGGPVADSVVEGLQAELDPFTAESTLDLGETLPTTPIDLVDASDFRSQGIVRIGDPNAPAIVRYTGKAGNDLTGATGGSGVWPAGTRVTQSGGGDGIAPVHHHVTVVTATGLGVDVAGTVEPEAGYSLDGTAGTLALRASLVAAVERYIESVEPGGEVVRQKVIAAILSVRGVHDVGGVTLNGVAANVAVGSSPPQAPFLDDTAGIVEGSV